MARARKARIPGLIRTAKDMVDSYELSLKLSGKVRPDPQQLAKQKEHYSVAAEVIQPPRDVVEAIRKIAPGGHKTYLLNLWRRATILKAKGLHPIDVASGLREVIEKNMIPRPWAEKVLALAGYDPATIKEILDMIYPAGEILPPKARQTLLGGGAGAGAGAGGTPPGL
jgi:hypothetical protein